MMLGLGRCASEVLVFPFQSGDRIIRIIILLVRLELDQDIHIAYSIV